MTSDEANWTPAMERYFIVLMLDQLQNGNRLGHSFNKHAWIDMLTMFNSRFGASYDMDVLKIHFSVLWKQYNNTKELLNQSGFSWDDYKKMVVAEAHIWNAYIQLHPEAGSLWNKSLINFNDLCLIFAYTKADGRFSLSSHDVDFDDDIPGINAGDSSGESYGLVTCWTTSMDNYLTDLFLDQALKGNKISHEFIGQAWTEIVTTFNSKFGSRCPISVLKNRHEHLRKLYNGLSILLEQNGISWDDTQEMVTASDSVWDSCIKAYPYAQSYRNKSMPSYHKLSLIYGEENDYGENNHPADLDNEDANLMIGDVQLHANDDFPETYWTSSMDRCLIDLLLEQVRKGHKQGSVFKNDAWIDMALSFVERFGLQYDKNILISHYKSLGKQYTDMKNLIGRRDFSWDEKRQMVSASDNAWNACIKGNPDVKPYKTELKPNYNDLCLIFGNPVSNGRANQFGLEITCNGYGTNHKNGFILSTDWTPPMDRYFIDLMLEQIREGSMINKKFNKRAWVDMLANFTEEFGIQYNKDVLKSRFVDLRTQFKYMKILLDQNGFSWDELQQMIIADNKLWNAYVKRYPNARLYWNKTLPNYNDLFLIYGDASSEGCYNYSMDLDSENFFRVGSDGDEVESPASNNSCMDDDIDDGIDNIFGDFVSPAREFEIPDQTRKRKSRSPTLSNPRSRVLRSYKYESDEHKILSRGRKENEYNNSIEIVVDALQAIPGMDDEIFLEACKILEDEKKVKKFLSMDVNLRMTWLLSRLP